MYIRHNYYDFEQYPCMDGPGRRPQSFELVNAKDQSPEPYVAAWTRRERISSLSRGSFFVIQHVLAVTIVVGCRAYYCDLGP